MAERKKISLQPSAPARDPRRPRPRRDGEVSADRRGAPARPAAEGPSRPPRTGGAPRPERSERPPLPQRAERPPRPQRDDRDRPARRADRAAPPRDRAPPAPARAAEGDGVRVSKLMAERGLASRREADEWIEAGWVMADGRVVTLGQRVPADAVITIDPRARQEQAQRVTILLHKPVGYVSGLPEDGYEPAVALITPANRWEGDRSGIEFRGSHLRHLAPAGRLDIDSTGLLVFTQDGRIAKRLIGDQTRVEKEYLVRVASLDGRPLAEVNLHRLRHGLELDGVQLREAAVSWQNEEQLRFVLREGRKRQIRRMCELVGLRVLALKRVRIGSVPLGPLPQGQWRYLRDDERF